jgi:hypothetical protein
MGHLMHVRLDRLPQSDMGTDGILNERDACDTGNFERAHDHIAVESGGPPCCIAHIVHPDVGRPVRGHALIEVVTAQLIKRADVLTATGNLSRAVVAEMRELIEWPGYDQTDAFRLHKVINEPDFLPLHIVRLLAETAKLVRTQRRKLVATPLGKLMLSDTRRGSLPAIRLALRLMRLRADTALADGQQSECAMPSRKCFRSLRRLRASGRNVGACRTV